MGRQYSPDEAWPLHPKAYWRGPLAEARRQGWVLKTTKHDFGRLYCSDSEDACIIRVDSSAAGAEAYAIAALGTIRSCPHTQVDDATEARMAHGDVAYLLQEADSLLRAVEQLVMADRNLAHAYELFMLAEADADRAEQLIAEASLLEIDSELDKAAARNALMSAGEAPDLTPAGALAKAEERVDKVEDQAPEGLIDPARIERLRRRIEHLATQVR